MVKVKVADLVCGGDSPSLTDKVTEWLPASAVEGVPLMVKTPPC